MRRDTLAIDVGMHTGEDTARLLAHGFDVVAIEANPDLVEVASDTFANEIRSGQLEIINAAISDRAGLVSFGVSDAHTAWSSLEPEMIARNERLAGTTYRYLDVEAILFTDVLTRVGVPHFLKVDIEGLDMMCVRCLRGFDHRPAFISIESNVSTNRASAESVFDELAELWTLGYRRFRYVNQTRGGNSIPRKNVWDGPDWRSAPAALARAQILRAHQNIAGYGGRWSTTVPARGYNWGRRNLAGRPRPWYDLQVALA